MWAEIGASGQVERLACWDFILADQQLASLMGKGDAEKGKAMLEVMKSVRALDVDGDGQITELEFLRMLDPTILAMSEAAASKKNVRRGLFTIELSLASSCWLLLRGESMITFLRRLNLPGAGGQRAQKSSQAKGDGAQG